MQNHFVLDIESDGPCPGLYSMVSFGIVALWDDQVFFRGEMSPVSDKWIPDALAISEISREEHLGYPSPEMTMTAFVTWLDNLELKGRPVIWSDNPAFDWQFLNYYLHRFTGQNPFGFSARRIGDLYAGVKRDVTKASDWKSLRQTPHTHDPLDDARGNAEALRKILRDL